MSSTGGRFLAPRPPSPHLVCLGLLVCQHVNLQNEQDIHAEMWPHTTTFDKVSLRKFEAFLLSEIAAAPGRVRDPLHGLLARAAKALGPAHSHVCNETVRNLCHTLAWITTPDCIPAVFACMEDCMAVPGSEDEPTATPTPNEVGQPDLLDRDSTLGLFVRRVLLDYSKALFAGVAALFTGLRRHLAELEAATRLRATEGPHNWYRVLTTGSMPGWSHVWSHVAVVERAPVRALSRTQASDYIAYHGGAPEGSIGILSGMSAPPNRGPTDPLRRDVVWDANNVLHVHPGVVPAHWVRFLEARAARDVPAALESLRAHFDFGAANLARGLSEIAATRRFALPDAQYPLLSMASMHVALGHLGEADAVLHEAVAVAQQRGDSACVAFCLSLLAQLQAAANNPRADPLLHACHTRAGRAGLWRLQALTTLAMDARGRSGGNESAARAVPDWLSFNPITAQSGAGAPLGPPQHGTSANFGELGSEGPLSLPLEERAAFTAAYHGLRGERWSAAGHRALSDLSSDVQRSSFSDTQWVHDRALTLARVLAASPRAGDGASGATSQTTPARLVELCQAVADADPKVDSLWSTRLRLEVLNSWHEWCIESGQSFQARTLSKQLVAVSSTDPDMDGQLRARLAVGRALAACGRRIEARSLFLQLLHQTSRKAFVQHRVQCLLQLATLPLTTADHVAQPASPTAVAQALPWLLEAVSECTRREASQQCAQLYWEAVVLLSSLLLASGRPREAQARLQPVLPAILENATPCLQGAASLVMAKHALSSCAVRSAGVATALRWLQRAEAAWAAVSAWPRLRLVHYLQARLHHEAKDTVARDRAAQQFATAARKCVSGSYLHLACAGACSDAAAVAKQLTRLATEWVKFT